MIELEAAEWAAKRMAANGGKLTYIESVRLWFKLHPNMIKLGVGVPIATILYGEYSPFAADYLEVQKEKLAEEPPAGADAAYAEGELTRVLDSALISMTNGEDEATVLELVGTMLSATTAEAEQMLAMRLADIKEASASLADSEPKPSAESIAQLDEVEKKVTTEKLNELLGTAITDISEDDMAVATVIDGVATRLSITDEQALYLLQRRAHELAAQEPAV
jgi:hypothetical protein